ncbi:hypothetical protein G6F68_018419 [Rhizopus microsporus]|nr:hypothetical protein G6F68_018419 [Rhizopus microsporus]
MGSNNDVDISGYADSTNIASLAKCLSAIRLIILPDTVTTSVSGVKVSIANPFSAGMSISKVVAAVTYQGMPLGNIDQDISSNPIVISARSPSCSVRWLSKQV